MYTKRNAGANLFRPLRLFIWESVIDRLGVLQLQLELVRDERDELTIGGFALGIADRVAKEPLQSIQVASVPCHLDGVADGTFYPAGSGLECLCHLGVEDLGNGVDHVHIAHCDDDGFPQILVTLDVGRYAGRFIEQFVA